MPALKAVIFDMDGVLIDSEKFWQEAERDAFLQVGIPFELEDCEQTMGMRIDSVVKYWVERRPWNLEAHPQAEVASRIEQRVMDLVTERGSMLPGVSESLELFQKRGARLALASSSSFAIIRHILDALGLTSAFEVMHSAQDEINGKPSPDVYLSTLKLLDLPADGCIAIEDSRNGITAAKAAGLACIGVPDPHTTDLSIFDHADVVIPSLLDIDEALLAKLGF